MIQRGWVGLWLLLVGCAELQLVMPNPQVEPPETRGERGLTLGPSMQSSHLYESTNFAGERPPNLSAPSTHRTPGLAHGLYYAPASALDLGLELTWMGAGIGMGGLVKWQLLGDGVRAAKHGNFPVSIFVRAGSSVSSKSGDQKVMFGPGGYHWQGQIQGTYVQGGLSLGYRVANPMLIYVGGAVAKYDIETKISQDSADGGADPGGSYSANDRGSGWSTALGLLFSWRVIQFNVAVDYTQIDYKTAPDYERPLVSGGIKFNF